MEKLLQLDHFNVLHFAAMRLHIHSCKKKKSPPTSLCHLAKAENQDKLNREFGQEHP